jgi:hypothetical protein
MAGERVPSQGKESRAADSFGVTELVGCGLGEIPGTFTIPDVAEPERD